MRALSWDDIDFGNDTITVVRRTDRWGRIGQPKIKSWDTYDPLSAGGTKRFDELEAALPQEQVESRFPR